VYVERKSVCVCVYIERERVCVCIDKKRESVCKKERECLSKYVCARRNERFCVSICMYVRVFFFLMSVLGSGSRSGSGSGRV